MNEQTTLLSWACASHPTGYTSGAWVNTAQQELVDFAKANMGADHVFVVSLARHCGNTTVLRKLREQIPALTATFDRTAEISDDAWSKPPFAAVGLSVVEFASRATHIATFDSPTAKCNTLYMYSISVFKMNK